MFQKCTYLDILIHIDNDILCFSEIGFNFCLDIVEVEANCPDQGSVFEHGSQTEIVEPYRVIHYSCHPGFHLVGNRTQTCGPDGQWSPLRRPRCVTTSK